MTFQVKLCTANNNTYSGRLSVKKGTNKQNEGIFTAATTKQDILFASCDCVKVSEFIFINI